MNHTTDIPKMLRVLADRIESGQERADCMVAVTLCTDDDPTAEDEVSVYGWGAFESWVEPGDPGFIWNDRTEAVWLLQAGIERLKQYDSE
jgi:hypothetical protein